VSFVKSRRTSYASVTPGMMGVDANERARAGIKGSELWWDNDETGAI